MVSPPHSLPSTKVAFNEPENSPPLSPKRSFSFTDEGADVAGYFVKRRHVHNESEAARRAPLDPVSASEINNTTPRLYNDPTCPESSFQSLGASPEPRSGDGSHSMPTNETACSWPPAVKDGNADSTGGSSCAEHPLLTRSARYSFDARESCGILAAGSTPAWSPPSRSRSDLSLQEHRVSRWDVDRMTQFMRSRSSFIPYVRHPPGDPGNADPSSDDPARTIYGLVDDRDSIFDSSLSLGLTKRRCSESDVAGRGSWSLSLALGSQPLRADESPKATLPIGAERNRVVSMTPRRSRSLPPAELPSSDEDDRPHSRLKSDGSWRDSNNTHLLECPLVRGVPAKSTSDSLIVKDFNRLLRQTVYNVHSSKVFSPLSPLRDLPPTFSLTTNPTYQRYCLSSTTNKLSPRYAKGSDQRIRNLCDRHQPFVIELESTHCQECKRDTIGKRLLASRYRQRRDDHDASELLTRPVGFDTGLQLGSTTSELDKRGLWEEVAAVTSTSIEASPHLQDLHDFGDDDDNDDYPEIPDEDLLSDKEELGRGEHVMKFD